MKTREQMGVAFSVANDGICSNDPIDPGYCPPPCGRTYLADGTCPKGCNQ